MTTNCLTVNFVLTIDTESHSQSTSGACESFRGIICEQTNEENVSRLP